jgi:hypothetical protein
MTNTMVQGMVKQEFRGRVMSIYILMFLGMAPLGSFWVGYLTEQLGVAGAFRINTAVVFFTGLFVFLKRKRINAQYRLYKRQNGVE